MKLSFEQKVILLMSITPLLFVVFTLVFIFYTKSTLQNREIENGKILAKTFANNAKMGTLLDSPDRLDKVFEEYLSEPAIVATAVFNSETSKQIHARIDSILLLSPSVRIDMPFSEIRERLDSDKRDIVHGVASGKAYFYAPILDKRIISSGEDDIWLEEFSEVEEEEILVGVAELGVSLDAVNQSIKRTMGFSVIMTVIFVVAGAFVMRYIFSRWNAKTKELEKVNAMEKRAKEQLRKAFQDLEEKNRQFEEANQDLVEAQLKIIQSQAQQVESERLATLGELSGMVAHEINNALSGVSGPVDHILELPNLDHEKLWYCWESDQEGHELQAYLEEWDRIWNGMREAANLIKIAGERARTVVRDLQGIAGGRSSQQGPVDLCGCFHETIRLQKQRLMNVNLINNFEEEKMEIISTSGQINQIYTNMLINASHALEGRSEPTITVDIHHKDMNSRKGIEINISDNGCGMPFEVKSQVFKPFFTSKGERGTGLGLSTVDRIVKENGGIISVESEEGIGTTFTMWFPYERDAKDGEQVIAYT